MTTKNKPIPLRERAPKHTETAAQAYERNQSEIATMIANLQARLEIHAKRFEIKGGRDWGFVGDLADVKEKIGELLDENTSDAHAAAAKA